jgi:hypothetical protein
MKKLLPLATAALMLLPASVEAKPRYKQFKVMTRSTFGYAYCGWDSSIKDIKRHLANGWEFVSETPMQFQTRGFGNGGSQVINCVGSSVVLVKHE